MIKKIIVFSFICILVLSCTRNEPNSAIADPNATSLTLVTQYSTSVPEPSGLFYNSKTNSLWTVSDGNSTVYELDFQGRILKSLAIQSSDLEGITFSANCDTFYVAEETNRLVTKYLSNGTKLYSFTVDVSTVASHVIEGIAINTSNNHLFVLNEKAPCMLLEFVNKTELWRKQIDYTLDCSDIYYDKQLNCLWMVSDESSKVVKMSLAGDLIASYTVPITKMEGITIYQDKIYLINDSNGILYVFQKP